MMNQNFNYGSTDWNTTQYYDTARMDMLRQVYETGFAVDDIALYLDTHMDDPQAMEYYQYASQAYNDAVQTYEETFGPLMFTNVMADTWNWVDSPWPWEGGI